MIEPTITCPNCKTEIPLTESLAAPLLKAAREQYERKSAEKDAEVRSRETELARQQDELTKERENLDAKLNERLKAERAKIVEEEIQRARTNVQSEFEAKAQELTTLQQVLAQKDEKLAQAQRAQVELIRKQRELDDARREIDLTIETKVQESLVTVRDQARRETEQALSLKVREKEETISAMQRQIEELKRKSEQGSQQLQGEALELELEAILRSNFPFDSVEPVPKGEFGGDLIQRVTNGSGTVCGTILWETKRTRNWSDGWLAKLRGDQRQANADVALIVSYALPKSIENFGLVDGVWVTGPQCAVPVAIALRELLISVASARTAGEGQKTKMELVYEYLTGPRFRHRIEAIVEQFTEMQMDLDRERKAMVKLWARREQQIRNVVESTAGLYGDLQGIAGRSIQEIEGLSLQLLAGPSDE
jgi:hypothetical protein